MIIKERLEELIKEKRTIYWKFAKIKPSSWSKYTIMGNTIVKGNLKEIYSLDDLFETKEDFEWYREFGCVTRTEKLELPTWEEFKNQKIHTVCFFSKNTNCFFEMFIHEKNNKLVLYDHDCDYKYFNDIATKENYIKACRIAKAHFLGNE